LEKLFRTNQRSRERITSEPMLEALEDRSLLSVAPVVPIVNSHALPPNHVRELTDKVPQPLATGQLFFGHTCSDN